eukprot:gnl/TRDRNA2_/TRDRNA2_196150_c0_seq1.p1 gnl/TRDRNA2_/TRDRNA2_196150_c0~~gnl/TRDRNA2_/TRDRNA2_196150_c0_seq1.p1  ORF type:complete len:144 (-),score=24.70 gnl/TRDRNA2_/TRDRNA2_196150_c0_seq1:71-502(-)
MASPTVAPSMVLRDQLLPKKQKIKGYPMPPSMDVIGIKGADYEGQYQCEVILDGIVEKVWVDSNRGPFVCHVDGSFWFNKPPGPWGQERYVRQQGCNGDFFKMSENQKGCEIIKAARMNIGRKAWKGADFWNPAKQSMGFPID